MIYLLVVVIVILTMITLWQQRQTHFQKESIESLQLMLDHNRNNLEIYEQQRSELQQQLTRLRIELGALRQRSEALSQYQAIVDVEQYVLERQNQVELFAESVKFDAENMLSQCQERFEKVGHFLAEYEYKAKELTMQRAREKLGAYFHMANECQHLAEVSKALHHKIETHSQSYQLPAGQLIDELIEGYSHSDTAQHLSKVRQQVIRAVEQNQVVTCAFVDEQRRLSTIALFSQLFNSKADLYMQRVATDELGELIQALKDDFVLINHYGTALGHARIQEHFLALRLEELKFSALLINLKDNAAKMKKSMVVEHRVLQ